MDTEERPYWQLQEAKAMFSEVVRSANQEPQIITVHGKESAVILSIDDYRKLKFPRGSLVSFMEQSPWAGVELDLPERQSEKMRKSD
jgi:prevent-host-death family protein